MKGTSVIFARIRILIICLLVMTALAGVTIVPRTNLSSECLAQSPADAEISTPKTWGIAPILTPFYAPETGWGGVGSLIWYWNADRSAARPDTGSVVAIYTQKKQMLFGLNIDQYFLGDRFLVEAGFGYSDWRKTFYGIGGEVPDGYPSDFEEDYITKTLKSDFGLAVRLMDGLFAGVQWTFSDTDMDFTDEAVWLPESDLAGLNGGRVSGPGLTLSWDTRDEAFFPTRGFLFQAEFDRFDTGTGSDYDFDSVTADARFYFPVLPGQVLAVQGDFAFVSGDVPFYRLRSLSGDGLMRGIESDRYLDRMRIAFQTEYRFPIFKRFGGVVFASIGRTAPDRSVLLDDMKLAGGFGFRYTVEKNKKINLRLDIGFDQDGEKKFYFTLREAF